LPTNVETGASRGFAFVKVASLPLARRLANGELYFMYRYISHESCSHFDSLPLTSLTVATALDGADVGEGDAQRTLSVNIARSSGGSGGGGSTKSERRERKRQRVSRD
jgi:hypothetical protein